MSERIERRRRLSPWAELVEIDVGPPTDRQTYHALAPRDYATALALRPDGSVALIRQYRPAIDAHCWELPSGIVDPGEAPSTAAVRETAEETGYAVDAFLPLAPLYVDGGRLLNRAHAILAILAATPTAAPEPGLVLAFEPWPTFVAMAERGALAHASHVALVGLTLTSTEAPAFLRRAGIEPPWLS
ncbi:MAG: NUDIX hydrolase [Pseudomonadota bacterium]